jgi:hypothetical protein
LSFSASARNWASFVVASNARRSTARRIKGPLLRRDRRPTECVGRHQQIEGILGLLCRRKVARKRRAGRQARDRSGRETDQRIDLVAPLSLSKLKLGHIDGVARPRSATKARALFVHITPNRRVLLQR